MSNTITIREAYQQASSLLQQQAKVQEAHDTVFHEGDLLAPFIASQTALQDIYASIQGRTKPNIFWRGQWTTCQIIF